MTRYTEEIDGRNQNAKVSRICHFFLEQIFELYCFVIVFVNPLNDGWTFLRVEEIMNNIYEEKIVEIEQYVEYFGYRCTQITF